MTTVGTTQETGYRRDWWESEDPTLARANKGDDGKWRNVVNIGHAIRKQRGLRVFKQEEAPEYIEGKTDYTNREMELIADTFLREDVNRELCRKCKERDKTKGNELSLPYGTETGEVKTVPQFDKGQPVLDEENNQLVLDFPEYRCDKGHRWFKGEGVRRDIKGKNPILFQEHLDQRKKREIYTTEGVPDPSIVSGIYNRTHPEGRKVNSDDQRRKHGASFFR
jgi:hypothetical protein